MEYRKSLTSGGKNAPADVPGNAALTPEEQSMVKSAKTKASKPVSISQSQPGMAQEPKLNYIMEQENLQKAQQEKVSIANKAIEEAHAAALKSESLNDAVNRMTGLVDKGVGSTFMGALPWGMGDALMSIGHDNKRVQSLRDQLIDMYKTEGQTKAFDTLPELKIVAARIPDLGKSEDQNREDMAGVANLMDARRASGDFLEKWAKSHDRTLDGAREVLRGWMQHSPSYQAIKKDGRVSIEQNPHYIPLDTWARLRQQFSDRDIVHMRDSNKLQIIGGKVFVDK